MTGSSAYSTRPRPARACTSALPLGPVASGVRTCARRPLVKSRGLPRRRCRRTQYAASSPPRQRRAHALRSPARCPPRLARPPRPRAASTLWPSQRPSSPHGRRAQNRMRSLDVLGAQLRTRFSALTTPRRRAASRPATRLRSRSGASAPTRQAAAPALRAPSVSTSRRVSRPSASAASTRAGRESGCCAHAVSRRTDGPVLNARLRECVRCAGGSSSQ